METRKFVVAVSGEDIYDIARTFRDKVISEAKNGILADVYVTPTVEVSPIHVERNPPHA